MEHAGVRPVFLLVVWLLAHVGAQTSPSTEAWLTNSTTAVTERHLDAEDQVLEDTNVVKETPKAPTDYEEVTESTTFIYPSTPVLTTPVSSSVQLYRVNAPDGSPCILMEVDAVVRFKYKNKSGVYREQQKFIPPEATASGSCTDISSTLKIKWGSSFVLTWSFAKTPGGDHWYVNQITLEYNTGDDSIFQFPKNPGGVSLSTPRGPSTMLFPTAVGRSTFCPNETAVQLNNGDDNSAIVFLRNFRLQPFMYKSTFASEYECSTGVGSSFRDETAPIAVGSTLAILVLLTVTGYGVYRYFKIKKVQYDTME